MIDIEEKSYRPDLSELSEYVGNPLFDELCRYMDTEYQAMRSIEYSGDNALLGWNLKFKKAGRTLCTVYPRPHRFPLLIIVGKREKERVEAILPTLSDEFRNVYSSTLEGMNQRWLLFDFASHTPAFEDVLKVVDIRRKPDKGAPLNT